MIHTIKVFASLKARRLKSILEGFVSDMEKNLMTWIEAQKQKLITLVP